MWYDVRRALERDLSLMQKQLVAFFFNKQQRTIDEQQTQAPQVPMSSGSMFYYTQNSIMKNIMVSEAEEQRIVQKCIPHFTIRMINKLEGLVEEGVLTRDEFE